jgi:hypothetical protein
MSSFGLDKRLDEVLELSNPRVFPARNRNSMFDV